MYSKTIMPEKSIEINSPIGYILNKMMNWICSDEEAVDTNAPNFHE